MVTWEVAEVDLAEEALWHMVAEVVTVAEPVTVVEPEVTAEVTNRLPFECGEQAIFFLLEGKLVVSDQRGSLGGGLTTGGSTGTAGHWRWGSRRISASSTRVPAGLSTRP